MCLGGVLGTLVETQQFDSVISCRSSAQSTKKTCAGTIGCRARCAGAVIDSGRPDVYGAFMHEAFFVCMPSRKRVQAILHHRQAERDAAPAAVQQPKKQRSKHRMGEPAPGATPCWTFDSARRASHKLYTPFVSSQQLFAVGRQTSRRPRLRLPAAAKRRRARMMRPQLQRSAGRYSGGAGTSLKHSSLVTGVHCTCCGWCCKT